MSSTIEVLNQKIEEKHLLKHPFYQAWSNGELSIDDLRAYSRQYFAHVRAFPAYLSEMHSRCENLDSRRTIAANLADEEATSPTHPELWLDFAAGLGESRDAVLDHPAGPGFTTLVDTFRSVARMDTGLAAAGLYCYEKQIPAVSATKIQGLKDNYGIHSDDTLRYFAVHESADVEHAAQWEALLERHHVAPEQAAEVADRVLSALWGALDEVYTGCACKASVN
jgi:pyrroloquinoline-quinone synthase